jgi:hypothetical protein
VKHRSVSGKASWLAIAAWLACLVVLGTVVIGFVIVGSPEQARQERADSERVSDLVALTRGVQRYFTDHKTLPKSLDEMLKESVGTMDSARDPETRTAYEYRVIDKGRFELCATFQTDQSSTNRSAYYGYEDETGVFRKHRSGRQCFRLSAK